MKLDMLLELPDPSPFVSGFCPCRRLLEECISFDPRESDYLGQPIRAEVEIGFTQLADM